MRVPLYVTLPLCFATVAGVWWWNTREVDFLTPPGEEELAAIRQAVVASFPEPERGAPERESGGEVGFDLELGDLERPPRLTEYAAMAREGAGRLIDLAMMLETEGEFERARLAWERVLDFTEADETEREAAVAAVDRLREELPDWEGEPLRRPVMVLNAGAGPTMALELEPVLEQVVEELEEVFGGILELRHVLHVGEPERDRGLAMPVAIWLEGGDEGARSTEVMAFTVASADSLRVELLRTLYGLAGSHLGRVSTLAPPGEPGEGEDWLEALGNRVTRLAWHQLGISLEPPQAEPAAGEG